MLREPSPVFPDCHGAAPTNIRAPRMRETRNTPRPLADDFDGIATRQLQAYVRARLTGRDAKAKRCAALFGFQLSKAEKLLAGTYPRVSADDIFRLVARDGAGAVEALFGDFLCSRPVPLAGGEMAASQEGMKGAGHAPAPQPVEVRENLLAATAHLESALAAIAAGAPAFGEAGTHRVVASMPCEAVPSAAGAAVEKGECSDV